LECGSASCRFLNTHFKAVAGATALQSASREIHGFILTRPAPGPILTRQ
jgi:hypothetical protein